MNFQSDPGPAESPELDPERVRAVLDSALADLSLADRRTIAEEIQAGAPAGVVMYPRDGGWLEFQYGGRHLVRVHVSELTREEGPMSTADLVELDPWIDESKLRISLAAAAKLIDDEDMRQRIADIEAGLYPSGVLIHYVGDGGRWLKCELGGKPLAKIHASDVRRATRSDAP